MHSNKLVKQAAQPTYIYRIIIADMGAIDARTGW